MRVLVITGGCAITGATRQLLDCLVTRGDDVVIQESDNGIRGVNQRSEPIILDDITPRFAFEDFAIGERGREAKRSRKFARRTRTEGWEKARYAK